MGDSLFLEINQGILAESGVWYNNLQVLGTGGNAVTFLVMATGGANKGVLFALKIFRRLSKPERRERFLDEIKILRQLDHPSVMRIFDSGEFHDSPFLVAEFLPDQLAQVIRAGRLTTVEKLAFSLQLLSALTFLENREKKVVHRDIKPQNIFVKGKSCVLGDFGLFKVLDDEDEEDRNIFKESIGPGMPFYYRTPDLIKYARHETGITTKSDVFQLGLVLCELFTGRNPAKKPHKILDDLELDQIGHIPGKLGGSIAALLNRMLTLDVNSRPSASDLQDGWSGVFSEAAQMAHKLEGQIM